MLLPFGWNIGSWWILRHYESLKLSEALWCCRCIPPTTKKNILIVPVLGAEAER
jgi:hypothetical protein